MPLRIAVGASPFLLPLMFQLAFGLTPFQSGMITFVTAIGAIGMKFATAWIFRNFGFRRVLIAGSLVAAGTIAINGLFTPTTPYVVMILIILAGGFIRSCSRRGDQRICAPILRRRNSGAGANDRFRNRQLWPAALGGRSGEWFVRNLSRYAARIPV